MQIILTKHAIKRMHKTGIEEEQIIKTIKYGSKYKQTDGILASYMYVNVAFKKIGQKYIIKTVMIKK